MRHVIIILFVSAVLIACAVSPTGRNQVLLFSGTQMSQMGISAYNSMKQKNDIAKDPKANSYVRCITDRLLPHLPGKMKSLTWEINVFDDDSPNAFALPGAKIGINTGMLTLATNQHMIAAVIGHEIGHVWAKHGNERMSQSTIAQTGMTLVSIMAGENSPEKQLAMQALGIAAQGVVLKYSRVHESEADEIGLTLMAEAGFDPRQSIELWKKMAEKNRNNVPEFFSTHPSEATRIKQLQSKLARVMPIYEAAIKQSGQSSCTL